jgi:hypothetical protein
MHRHQKVAALALLLEAMASSSAAADAPLPPWAQACVTSLERARRDVGGKLADGPAEIQHGFEEDVEIVKLEMGDFEASVGHCKTGEVCCLVTRAWTREKEDGNWIDMKAARCFLGYIEGTAGAKKFFTRFRQAIDECTAGKK